MSKDRIANELMDQIYDTLMGNVGLSKFHTAFPLEDIENQLVENGKMYFEYKGKAYEVSIKQVEVMDNDE